MKRALPLLLVLCAPAAAARPRLLLLGDSLTAQYFGRRLDARLRAGYTGYDVETHGYCGSQPAWFLPAKTLPPALRHYSGMSTWCGFYDSLPGRPPEEGSTRPAPIIDDLGPAGPGGVAVIALGTNLIASSTGTEHVGFWGMDLVTQLAERAQKLGWRCIWVGPPKVLGADWKGFPGASRLSARLAKAVGRAARGCAFVDSVPLTRGLVDARRGDGIHYLQPAGELWADRVYKRLRPLIPPR